MNGYNSDREIEWFPIYPLSDAALFDRPEVLKSSANKKEF